VDMPTRRLPNGGLLNSWTGQVADWTTHGLDSSQTSQLAGWTTRGGRRQ